MIHELQVIRDGFGYVIRAYCTCKAATTTARTDQQVEDWWIEHEHNVQRALAALHRRNPSLKATLRHYEKMAMDPSQPETDRRQWQLLADELQERIESKALSDEDQLGLW